MSNRRSGRVFRWGCVRRVVVVVSRAMRLLEVVVRVERCLIDGEFDDC